MEPPLRVVTRCGLETPAERNSDLAVCTLPRFLPSSATPGDHYALQRDDLAEGI